MKALCTEMSKSIIIFCSLWSCFYFVFLRERHIINIISIVVLLSFASLIDIEFHVICKWIEWWFFSANFIKIFSVNITCANVLGSLYDPHTWIINSYRYGSIRCMCACETTENQQIVILRLSPPYRFECSLEYIKICPMKQTKTVVIRSSARIHYQNSYYHHSTICYRLHYENINISVSEFWPKS